MASSTAAAAPSSQPSSVYGPSWDAEAGATLLAPLVGLPFDQMVHNGTSTLHPGNRG